MPITIKVKLTKIGNSLRITVPKHVIESLKWREGDMLEIGIDDSRMTVKRALRDS